jgi:uncharacterized DUF497 family protein
MLEIEFDPAKDAANIAKHGLSPAQARELEIEAIVKDDRFAGEQRYRIYGTLNGRPHCLAAVLRGGFVRAISFRRAHSKEYDRHA